MSLYKYILTWVYSFSTSDLSGTIEYRHVRRLHFFRILSLNATPFVFTLDIFLFVVLQYIFIIQYCMYSGSGLSLYNAHVLYIVQYTVRCTMCSRLVGSRLLLGRRRRASGVLRQLRAPLVPLVLPDRHGPQGLLAEAEPPRGHHHWPHGATCWSLWTCHHSESQSNR